MKLTLLGTGDVTSVPAPLCDCEFCVESGRRRHPSVLVETDETRLLFDVGPDVQEQLHEVDVREVDAAFLAHAHGDHSAGLPTLSQTLNTLAENGLVERRSEEAAPIAVYYRLTEKGADLESVFDELDEWARMWIDPTDPGDPTDPTDPGE